MDYKTVLTTCPYCGSGCSIYLEVLNGRVVGVIPGGGSQQNDGKLCIKGWNAHEFIHSANRLTHPMLRKKGALCRVSWDEALDFVAQRLKKIKSSDGSDSIGFMASAKMTNEENYLLQKFARACVGTNNIDNCARL
jgi:predicted molibdopterin-dependent oxidoreductase YjgC